MNLGGRSQFEDDGRSSRQRYHFAVATTATEWMEYTDVVRLGTYDFNIFLLGRGRGVIGAELWDISLFSDIA
jgi:hypothetical protein